MAVLQRHDIGQNEVCHDKSADHKAAGSDQRGKLQVGQAHDGVPAGAAASISGAEAYQQTAYHHHDKATQREQAFPGNELRRRHAAEIGNAVALQFSRQPGRYLYGFRIGQHGGSDECTRNDAADEEKIPDFLFPVVFEKLDVGRQTGGAGVAQIGR